MSTDAVKTCSKCRKDKPPAAFEKKGARCKECASEYRRQYYAANREKIKVQHQKYVTENREKHNEWSRKWAAANRDKRAQISRNYNAANREKTARRKRHYNAENRKKIADYWLRYKASNPNKRAEANKRYAEKLPDALVAKRLIRNTNLTRADIPPELLEAKRLQLKLKRLAREAMK